jgi:hypothetical protein
LNAHLLLELAVYCFLDPIKPLAARALVTQLIQVG